MSSGSVRRRRWWLLLGFGAIILLALGVAGARAKSSFDYFGAIDRYAIKERTLFLKANGPIPERVLHGIHVKGLSARETADLVGQRLRKEGFERRHEGMDVDLGEEEFYKSGAGDEYIDIVEVGEEGSKSSVILYERACSTLDNVLARISSLGRDPYVSEDDVAVTDFAKL